MAGAFDHRVIPVVFRTPRSLAMLNVIAVGFAISVVTSAGFVSLWWEPRTVWPVVVGFPTLAIGMFWAALLRRREKIGRIAMGWVMSVPLAALNAALACALMLASESPQTGSLLAGFFLGATFGVIVWAPALVAILVIFGLPIARARKLAATGLAGEERGERFVGIVCIVLVALAALFSRTALARGPEVGSLVFYAMAIVASGFGAASVVVAQRRERARRRFVARVEAEEVPGLRIEPRALGKVIVRVEPHIDTYRLAPEADEELFDLDDEGRALRPSGLS